MKIHWRQISALLKKDFIIKTRQPWLILLQFFWPVGIFVAMYILRNRFPAWEQPACNFVTRQLPSTSDTLPFFQSYLCTLENQCNDIDKFEETPNWDKAPATPLLNIVQTILNQKDLYDGVVNLPDTMDFFNLVIKFATSSQFKYLESNALKLVQSLPETRKIAGNFDVKKVFADDRILSSLGNLVCARPFPRSNEIRFVENFIYTKDYAGPNKDEVDAMPTPYCKQLYLDVARTNHGKITWNILKPLIQGKVIFGPVNEKTLAIIGNANSTFTEIDRLLVFVRSIEKTIVKLSEDESFRRKLDSLLAIARTPFIKAAVGDALDLDSIENAVSSIVNDTKVLEVIRIAGNALECYSVNRFVSVNSEKELEDRAFELSKKKLFWGAVYFVNSDSKDNETTYKLRMETENTPKTVENKNRFWFPDPEKSFALNLRYHRGFIQIQTQIDQAIIKYEIDKRTPAAPVKDTKVSDDIDDFDFETFEDKFGSKEDESPMKPTTSTSAQPTSSSDFDDFDSEWDNIVTASKTSSKSPIEIPSFYEDLDTTTTESTPSDETTTLTFDGQDEEVSKTRNKRQSGILDLLTGKSSQNESQKKTYYTKQMPFPKYVFDAFMRGVYFSQGMQLGFFFALIIHVASFVRNKIWFRESENLKIMNIMGMRSSSEAIAWFISSFVELVIIFFLILCILFNAKILQYSNMLIVFFIFIVFGISVITFCYMASAFFSMATIGSVATVIIFMMNFCPYIIIISLDAALNNFFYFIVNLSSPTAFCYTLQYIVRGEVQQKPLTFSLLFNESLADNDLVYGLLMMIFDAILYFVIGFIAYKGRGECQSTKICHKRLEKNVAAVVKDLTKIYDGADPSKPYVKNVSLSFRRDEIFCILGRNGAGKSTIMKVLSGQIEPTHGEVFLPLDYDLITGIENPNEQIGICTQNNILIPNLTVLEHLQLYASMKMRSKTSKEIRRVLYETKLDAYRKYQASALSGGYQRRLCIAIAFLGSPDLVILDEPCNGIDLEASKSIWTMITKFKVNRAVFIATHNLDEVQFLADRIAILKDGNCVYESQMESLREDLSGTFNIAVDTTSNNTEPIENVFKSNSLSYDMKNTSEGEKVFNATVKRKGEKDNLTLIQELETMQSKNIINGFRVSNRTLNDLFENVDSSSTNQRTNNHYETNNNDSIKDVEKMNNHKNLTFIQSSIETQVDGKNDTIHRSDSAWRKFKMLLWKRFKHYSRNYKLMVNILVLPIIFEIIAIIFMKIRPPGDHDVAITFNRSLYPNSVEFYSQQNLNNFSELIYDDFQESCISSRGEDNCNFFDSSSEAYKWFLDTHEEYIGRRYGGVSVNDTKFVVWYNNKGYHSMPLYLNLLHTMTLREEIDDPNYNITTINHPLRLETKELSISSILQQIADSGPSLIFLVAFSLVLAGFSVYIVNERVNGEKHQQKLSGVSGLLYWTVAFIWDFTIYCFCVACCAAVFAIMRAPIFSIPDNMAGGVALIIAFGFAMIPGVHLMEKLFNEASLAKMGVFCINLTVGLTTVASILILDILAETDNDEKFKSYLNRIFLIFPQHALADGFLEMCKNHILAGVFSRFGLDTYRKPLSSDLLKYHFTSLISLGVILTILNLILEYRGSINKALKRLSSHDENIMNVKNISRSYDSGKHYSIKNISFGIKKQECLGLIGPNGAGKSTILKILSRRTKVFKGTMECDKNLKVSFCPQTNILDPNLSVDEMIKFYANLRSIRNVDEVKERILQKFLLKPYENFLVKNLSGGNKRKLNVACATIQKSGLMMLDEPTSDMDPITRQMIYRTIYELQRDGCSVVLTSHSIAEIEHLCQNVVILTNGTLKTAGSVSELRQRFGRQYAIGIFGKVDDEILFEKDLIEQFKGNLSNFMSFNSFRRFTVDLRQQKNDKRMLSDVIERLDQFTSSRNLRYTLNAFTLEEIFESLISDSVVISTENYDNKGFVSD